ncbi:hypothetical protein M422DRAFT_265592 [Sphaerobolus stellatus SS14]|uniref:Uncharacterized protein n=1 Tax=Sphaerobolus stellatus (strain SS14) TaxID=990650 RepID=A0A0C9UCX6_SPHS4|nr:hypothetical protein M422DRAFT_265592 [Sphaerobolus stellatus SS14]
MSVFHNKNLRATSQLPQTGYLSQKLQQPDSSPSSSSNSSHRSSSSSGHSKSTEKKKIHKKRMKTRVSKATSAKITSPRTYDGSANYEEFDRWTYEVNNWMDITKFPKSLRVRHIGSFMTGKASKFYYTHVALNPKKYTVDSLGRELFNYCFPPRFRQNMHDNSKKLYRGGEISKIRIRYLESLAARVPDIDDFDIIQQLAKNAAPYLQIEWAEAGFTEDFTSLEEYEESGYRFEQAEELRIYLEKKLARDKIQPSPQYRHNDRQGQHQEEYPQPTNTQNQLPSRNHTRRPRPWEENSCTHSPNFKNYTP